MDKRCATTGSLAGVGVRDGNVAVQAAAGRPATLHRGAAWFDDRQKVVHDLVGYRFVENPFVAKSLQVHFQTLQFHTHFVRYIRENDRSVVRLAGFGADRRELGADMFDRKVSLWARVVKHFKQVAERFTHVGFSADDYRKWKRVRSELCAAK
jgi:hypothetical protein